MKQTNKSSRLTDQEFQNLLYQELNEGNLIANKKTAFWQLLKTVLKKQIDKSRSIRLHDLYYPEWAKINQAATTKAISANAAATTNDALKTRNGKIDWYIQEVRKIEAQLRGDLHFTFIIHTKTFPSHNPDGKFQVPVQVQDLLRRTLREYISELSKLSGEYVTKIAETDGEGNDKQKFDVSEMPTELLFQIAKFISKPQ